MQLTGCPLSWADIRFTRLCFISWVNLNSIVTSSIDQTLFTLQQYIHYTASLDSSSLTTTNSVCLSLRTMFIRKLLPTPRFTIGLPYVSFIIIIIIMEKTEAGLRGLCIREIDVKSQILVTEYYSKLQFPISVIIIKHFLIRPELTVCL